jgi:hypothetical protein
MPPGAVFALEDVLCVTIEMNATDSHVQVGLRPCFDPKEMARILGRT